jgi:RNA polymerase sigma factor (sigma-70 family)
VGVSGEHENPGAWEAALAAEVHQRGRLLFRVAYALLRDAAAAEDVCQQAFLRAWEERSRIRSREALGSWLVRTVTNDCLQIVRRRRIERKVMGRYASGLETDAKAPGHEGELRDAVLDGLAKLPDVTQSVVVLRVMQGMSGDQVKGLIGCSASEVSRQLHRGLELLRHRLPEFEMESNG